MTFAEMLYKMRKARGVSQSALARTAGMDASHLNRIERGIRNPPRRGKVIALAQALRMTPEETDYLLISAGYAPEGIVEVTKERAAPPIAALPDGASPETLQLIQRITEELVSLMDNINLKPHDRSILQIALEPLPLYFRELKRLLILPDEEEPALKQTSVEVPASSQEFFVDMSVSLIEAPQSTIKSKSGNGGNGNGFESVWVHSVERHQLKYWDEYEV